MFLMSLFRLYKDTHANVTQVNDAHRLSRQQLHEGVIRGGHSPVAGYSDFGLCTQNNTLALLIAPLPWGRTRVLAEPFLSPQRRTGWIGQD